MLKENSSYSKQWATVFLLLYGPNTINAEDVSKLLFPILSQEWDLKEKPVVYNSIFPSIRQKIVTGPWSGRDSVNIGPEFTAVKWNIRRLDKKPVNEIHLGTIRNNYREKIVPLLPKIGLANEYVSARNYGTPFDKTVDKGLPKNPPIPPEPKSKWWLWLGLALVGALTVHRTFKKKKPNVLIGIH